MANVKISQLPSATTPLGGSEEIPLVQGTTTKKVTVGGLFDSPVMTTPDLGTPSAVDLTNATNVPMAQASGTLPVVHGGTGATTASGARSNLGAAASGANSDITSMSGITGAIGTADYVAFDTGYATTLAAGQLGWDGNNTLGIGMAGGNVIQKIGEDSFYYIKASSAITKGQVVMFTGAVGASGVVTGAPATGVTEGSYIMGVAAESIALNGFGLVQTEGTLRGLNTSAYVDGDILWYNPAVTGGLTKTKPSAPNVKVQVAAVVNAGSGSSGSILIRVAPGSVLGGTDSNVEFGTLANNDLIQYDSANQYWKNVASISGSQVSGNISGNAGNVTGTVAIANGGTGQTTANAALNALLPSQTGNNGKVLSTDGTNTSWVTSGSGTVTSVDVSGGTTGLTTSGGPVTTSGTVTLAGTLNVANGGTGATTLTGYVKGNGTSAMTASSTVPTSDLTGTLAVANGGTGQTSYTDGQLLIGNSATGGLTKATLTAGTNVSIVNSNGAITIAATGGSGGGDVSGPASATNNAVVLFDGTTGKLIKDSAQTIASANTASTVVARDSSGNFSAGTITAALSGNASTATALQTARTINGTSFDGTANITITANTTNALTAGSYLTSGGTFDGSAARTFAVDATDANTASKVVARDASGNFSAGTITATLNGNATNVTGTVAVANGGTGLTATPTNGQLDIGNGTGFTRTTLTQGTGISITNGAGSITVANSSPMTYPGAGIPVSTGTAWTTSKTAPTGDIVGTTDTQTLSNKTIAYTNNTLTGVAGTAAANTFTATQTFNGTTSSLAVVLADAAETATISATAATGTINYDVTTQSVLYYTSNASANWTVNLRGSSGTSLNTLMSTGQSVTVVFMVTQGTTAYYNSALQIDGSSVTPKWQGGSAPTSGNASGIDVYSYTVIKTANATFTVLASQTQFK